MKKYIIAGLVIVIAIVGYVSLRQRPADPKDAAYIVAGKQVTLVAGRSETVAVPGSAEKVVTQYFGNEALGDLDGDGDQDTAFVLTQTGAGSGTFYYVAVALRNGDSYAGTNAVLFGDRIAPQTTEIRDGEVVVNYADRSAGEPMTIAPSVGTSMRLKIINGSLVAVQ